MIEAMVHELELRKDYLDGATINTVYFGGGTPSLLTADEINRLFDAIRKNYPVEQLQEVTLEANPDDLDRHYLQSLRRTPVSRFSIGVQSFRDADLQYMKRAHNAQQADYAIKAAQDAGFDNITIDLIYGTPGLTDKDWKLNLSRVSELSIPHFSAYALTVEEKTALHHAIQQKKTVPVDPEQAAGQLEILMEQAAIMGYEHYEISNLALPGRYAVHNTSYWMGAPYLGIGPSAHSFNGKDRRWNVANNIAYTKSVLAEHSPLHESEVLTPVQHLNEYIMTSLRTMWGCDLNKIADEWDSDLAVRVEKSSHLFQEKRWIAQDGMTLKLTTAGRLFADRIASEMFQ
jgi:oxygen-independent coproporphyrinogen-3 oxidase